MARRDGEVSPTTLNVDRCLAGGSVDASQNDDKNSLNSSFTKFN